MNKGIKAATGDIVGTLNSDDLYFDGNVIEIVADVFEKYSVDSCYGDLIYVDKNNTDKIIRYWKAKEFRKENFRKGWMPPHPTFFVKREIYEKYGFFNLDFPIAADYEIMLRFLYKYGISTRYIPRILLKMRIGGKSNKNLVNIIKANTECYRAWRENGLSINPLIFALKPLSKISQFPFLSKNDIRG
jgi:glycosyltransferase